jgi:hypothetical protein
MRTRRISDRSISRNLERHCWFAGVSYDYFEIVTPPSSMVRLIRAHNSQWIRARLTDPQRDTWEPSKVTLGAIARQMSKHGAPLGGTKAHRRLLRTRRIQRIRRMHQPQPDTVDAPF